MQLKLNLNGSVEPLSNWLKKFEKIRPSLLIEIDTNLRAFIAKTFIEDKSAVRYSSISFEDCNISVVSDESAAERGEDRVNLAVLLQLPKLIKIIDRFGQDADKEGVCAFDITIEYDRLSNMTNGVKYASTSIKFSSPIITMRMDGFRVEELTYITDQVFRDVVFNVDDSFSFVLSAQSVSSIIKTSEIIKTDGRSDALVFYVEGKSVFVKDRPDGGKQPTMVYCIGELDAEPNYGIEAVVKRSNFIRMLDKTDEDYKVILGRRLRANSKIVDRILFDSLTTPTKIVVSIMCDA